VMFPVHDGEEGFKERRFFHAWYHNSLPSLVVHR
jgi:hypothetical protein